MSQPDSTPFATLASALRERLAAIADREAYAKDPEDHLERLKAASERINAAAEKLPGPLPPELAHYLQRASLDKALAWLEANYP